jgi:hypothetical protein
MGRPTPPTVRIFRQGSDPDSDLEPTKATWLPSSFEGTMGVAFSFGSD